MEKTIETPAQIPDSFYALLGVILFTQATLIVTVIGAAFKVWGRFVLTEAKTDALHTRVDKLEDKRYTSKKGE